MAAGRRSGEVFVGCGMSAADREKRLLDANSKNVERDIRLWLQAGARREEAVCWIRAHLDRLKALLPAKAED